MTSVTIATVAEQASDWFETAERPDGETFVRLRDGRPEWLQEAVRSAHDDLLPDDRIYRLCRDALEAIAGASDPDEAAHEFADGAVDVYTEDLLDWARTPSRLALAEDTAKDHGVTGGVEAILRAGQYAEAERVYQVMAEACAAQAEASDEDEDE